jgi:recombination protein RecT
MGGKMSGEIVPVQQRFLAIEELVNSKDSMTKIARALPNHITAEKMARVFLTACTTTPKLLDCDPASLMKAVMEASALGLLTDGVLGHGYILPFGRQAKFIPGFRGLMDMARRSGNVAGIQARIIYAGDDFYYEYGAKPIIRHIPAQMSGEEPGGAVGAYATATLIDTDEVVFEVMWQADIEKIRERSPAGRSGPWVTDTLEMWRKTPLRRLMKYLPLSAEVQSAVTSAEYAEAGTLAKLVEVKIDKDTGEVLDAESVETLDTLVSSMEGDEPKPDFEGKGKISTEEDERFESEIERLVSRAEESSTEELARDMYNKMLGGSGVVSITEIRIRADREKFYKELESEVVAWEESV